MSQAEPGIEEEALTLSALLTRLACQPDGALSMDDIVSLFGARSFGAALLIFAVPNLLPLPPGSSTVLGLPLLLLAPQLACGRSDPWLPRSIGRRTIEPAVLAEICRRVTPWVAKIERLTTRRMGFVFGGPGDVVIGLVCTVLAAVLILPIPLGNLLPAAAVAILGLSLVQRDGLLAIVGHLAAALSLALLALSGHIVVEAVNRLLAWMGM